MKDILKKVSLCDGRPLYLVFHEGKYTVELSAGLVYFSEDLDKAIQHFESYQVADRMNNWLPRSSLN